MADPRNSESRPSDVRQPRCSESRPSDVRANEMVNYVAANELVEDAWKASCNAYNCKDYYFNEFKKDIVFFALCGFPKFIDLTAETDFDECEINNGQHQSHQFPTMNDGHVECPKPALVRKVILDRFRCGLERWTLADKIRQAREDNKTVIFTGHSFGGAIATLWTVWALEQRPQKLPICITFGCPLVGDKTFAKAIEREKWSPYFYHIVSRYDIVPRLCFSPFKLPEVYKALESLVPYWYKAMETQAKETEAESKQPLQNGSHSLKKEDSLNFIKRVIRDASQIVTYETEDLTVGSANLLRGAVKDLIRPSPYRPFGYYVFCSSTGTACYIENPKAVLQMLYFALENNKLSEACITDHIEYEKTIDHICKISGRSPNCSKIQKSDKSPEDVGLELQLESMGIGMQNVQAWLGLKTVKDKEEKVRKNMEEQDANLEKMQTCMATLEWYKISGEGNDLPCYNKTKMDLKAIKCRVELAKFWDHIIELVEKEELPPDFQTREKWIKAGTEYRLLVEPLDNEYYDRFGENDEYKNYLVAHDRSPRRYKVLEKWLIDDKRRKPTQDSAPSMEIVSAAEP